MENQIYRVELTDKKLLEFFICDTNDVEPVVDQKEISIVVFDRAEFQLDATLDMQEVDSLIDYLQAAKRHCERYNYEQREKLSNPELLSTQLK